MSSGGWNGYAAITHAGLRILWEMGPQSPQRWTELVDEQINGPDRRASSPAKRERRLEHVRLRLEPLRTMGLVEMWDDGTVYVRREGVGVLAKYPNGFSKSFVELMMRSSSPPGR
jgi:hypothetical protein